jgi:hypothetical protein
MDSCAGQEKIKLSRVKPEEKTIQLQSKDILISIIKVQQLTGLIKTIQVTFEFI